jgi:hypothetical protein
MRAGRSEQATAVATRRRAVARQRGAKVWLAYAEWLRGGPRSPAFVRPARDDGRGPADEGVAPDKGLIHSPGARRSGKGYCASSIFA